jgi:hypothetical protein
VHQNDKKNTKKINLKKIKKFQNTLKKKKKTGL